MTQWNFKGNYFLCISFLLVADRFIYKLSKFHSSLNILIVQMTDICIACGKVVGKRQHGVTCDLCDRWQHRVCDTGKWYFIFFLFNYLFARLYLFIYPFVDCASVFERLLILLVDITLIIPILN